MVLLHNTKTNSKSIGIITKFNGLREIQRVGIPGDFTSNRNHRDNEELVDVIKEFRRKWKTWATPTKISLSLAALAVFFGVFQASPQLFDTMHWLKGKFQGDPPITAPLPQQIQGALVEMQDNIDCLSSYNSLRSGDVYWTICRPRSVYMKSLSRQFSVLMSHDQYDESENIYDDWVSVIDSYDALSKIDTHDELLEYERNSPLTLRDTLFLTAFFKYYYEKYYFDASKSEIRKNMSQECRDNRSGIEASLAYNSLTEKWDDWPARRTIIADEKVKTIGDWHGLID